MSEPCSRDCGDPAAARGEGPISSPPTTNNNLVMAMTCPITQELMQVSYHPSASMLSGQLGWGTSMGEVGTLTPSAPLCWDRTLYARVTATRTRDAQSSNGSLEGMSPRRGRALD